MSKVLTFLAFLVALIWSSFAMAYEPPPSPAHGMILDQANVLSPVELTNLATKLQDIQNKSKNEIGVLIISSLDGEAIEDVGFATFNAWKIGQEGQDNGVLLVVVINDHKTRIETGKGVGGELTDIQSKAILDSLKPFFKEKKFAEGITSVVEQIDATLEHRETNVPTPPKPWPTWLIVLLVFLVIAIYIGISVLTGDPTWIFGILGAFLGASGGSSSSSSGSSSGGFGGGSSGGGGANSDW